MKLPKISLPLARGPLFVAASYGVISLLWITGSDLALEALVRAPRLQTALSIGKGYAFVLLTALLLYVAICHLQRRAVHAAAKLTAFENTYADFFENYPSPMWLVAADSQRFLVANRMAETVYGYSRERFAQLTLADLVDREVCDDLPRLLHRDGSEAPVREGVSRHRTADGRLLQVEVMSVSTTVDGAPACLLTATDITRRVAMERDLRASRNLLRFAQQLAGFVTVVTDLKTGAVDWSEQALALFGFAADQAPDQRALMALVHPDDRAVMRAQLRALEQEGATEVTITELRFCLPGGARHMAVRARSRHDSASGRTDIVAAFVDITERKRMEQRLAGSESHYRQLVDLLPDALFVLRPDLHIDFANPVAAQLFGAAAPEQLLGRDIADLVDGGIDEGSLLRAVQANPGVQTVVRWRRFRRLDGALFAGTAIVTVRPGETGAPPALQLVVRDMTDLQRVETQLAQANERLQRVSSQFIRSGEDVRRQLASELHDDVGQLLTFVTLTAATLTRQLAGSEAENRATALHGAAREALAKVRDLTLMLRPAQLDDAGIEVALRDHLGRLLSDSGLGYQLHCAALVPRPDPEVELALFRIAQEAVTNVLRHAGATRVDLWLERRGEQVELRVLDDGMGFDVGRKLAAANTAGLAGMRERAQLLGGELRIRATPGVGTELIALLPLRASTATAGLRG